MDRSPFRGRRVGSPPRPARRFSVWNGVSINPRFRSVAEVAAAVLALAPATPWDEIEWLVKAGEGGSYQAAWLHPSWGDGHPLAVDSAAKLGQLIQAGQTA